MDELPPPGAKLCNELLYVPWELYRSIHNAVEASHCWVSLFASSSDSGLDIWTDSDGTG